MSAATAAQNRRAILAMCAAMALFVANDSLVKLVSERLPIAQLVFLRGLMASALVAALLWRLGLLAQWRQLLQPAVLQRASIEAVGSTAFLVSLSQLPLANATAINLAAPLVITVMAVLFLRQRLAAARWAAVAVGFVGVLLIIQPRASGFNGYAWLCLAATFFHAARDLATRRIAAAVPSLLITLSTALAVTGVCGLGSLVQGWRTPSWADLARLAGAATLLSGGNYFIISAMRAGDVTLVAPFRYVGLLFALVLGWALWGDVPNALAWAGIALLVGSGLHLLLGERLRRGATMQAQDRSPAS